MDDFLMGAIAMAMFTAGLFFLRYWRDTSDRLFLIFAIAFWLLGLTRVAMAWHVLANAEHRYLYWLRLLAFSAILMAIVDKNISRRPKSPQSQ